jgi:hypothetical protein
MIAVSIYNFLCGRSLLAGLGFALTFGALSVIAIMIVIDPSARTVTPVYISAASKLFDRENFYTPETSDGFLYLPVFAMMFYPLTLFGLTICNLARRAAILLCLAFAVSRGVRRLNPRNSRSEIIGLTLLFAICGSAGAVRNGQSTTLLLAAIFLAFDAAYDRHFARAAAWATLAVIAKPPGIVVWLLIAGARPKSLPWLVGFLVIAFLAPFALLDMKYGYLLYAQFAEILLNASPELGRGAPWTDFMAIPRGVDLSIAPEVVYAISRLLKKWRVWL